MEFDDFTTHLFEEAKCFCEKAKKSDDPFSKEAYLHACLLLGMSALEACVNSIIEEITVVPYKDNFSLLEQSLLLEKDVRFKDGCFTLSNNLKISRLTDKIDFLLRKYNNSEVALREDWYMKLKQSIDLRNKLVHPKEKVVITERNAENAMDAVLETMNNLYLAVYKKNIPVYSLELHTRHDLS